MSAVAATAPPEDRLRNTSHSGIRAYMAEDETLPTPPPPPAPVPPGPGVAPVYPPPPKRYWTWVVVIVVAAVVVVAVLVFAGVFSSHGSSSVGNGTPAAFSAAVDVASSQGTSITGAPWTVVAADGIGIPSGLSEPNWEFVGSSGCTFTPVPGGSTQVTILGTPANSAAGEVATWVFFEKNASANVILLSAVSNGALIPLILVTGCSTVGTFATLSAVSASTVVDSTVIAASFNENGGSSFLSSHSGATQTFILIGGSSSSPAAWDVEYSTCALTASGGSGDWLSGYYYASNGNVLSSPTSGSGAC